MPGLKPWKPIRSRPQVRPPMLARERLNIMSGRNWLRAADKRYDSKLEGLGALGLDVEMGPASSPGVGTLQYVGEYIGVGDDDVTGIWDMVNNTRGAKSLGAVSAMIHGYKRNRDLLWALIWGALGYWQPVAVNGVAAAQGYAKWKHKR